MAYITYHHTYGQCPSWKINVCISGKYVINEDTNKERFIRAECSIIQQLKLPYNKRELIYRDIPFCDQESNCPLLKDFPLEINPK